MRYETLITKRAIVAKKLASANMYLMDYGHKDVAINVARQLLQDAERRVKCGFGPVPVQDAENLLAIENKYQDAIR